MYVISYDITDTKRRNKIFKVLKNYGEHKQYSVFECDISKKRFDALYRELLDLMDDELVGVRERPNHQDKESQQDGGDDAVVMDAIRHRSARHTKEAAGQFRMQEGVFREETLTIVLRQLCVEHTLALAAPK